MKHRIDTKEQLKGAIEEGLYKTEESCLSSSIKDGIKERDRMPWKSGDMFGNLLESVPEMIFAMDVNGDIFYTNKAFRGLTDYPCDVTEVVSVFDMVHTENQEAFKQRFNEVLEGNSVCNIEFKLRTNYDSYIDVQVSLSPVADSDGKIVAAFVISRDITEQKQLIEQLRDSEEMHSDIIENSPDIMFTTDVEGKMLSMNKASKTIFELDPNEMIGKLFTDFIREEALPQILKDYQQVLSGNKVINETVVVGKGGKERRVEAITLPLFKGGAITKIHGIVRDITDYRLAEDKLRLMFDSMTDGVIVTDLEGNIIELNERTAEIHGFDSKDRLLGRNALTLIPQVYRERVAKEISHTLELGQIGNIEYRLLKKDGSQFWGEMNASVMKDTFGKPVGLVGILRDISQRKLSEQMLQRSQEKLQSIMKAMPDSIFHIDRCGTIIGEPMGYNKMVGLYRSALSGRKLYDVFPYEFADKAMKAINKTLQSDTLQVMEYTWIFPPGNNSIYEIRVAPCGIDEVIAIVRDITDQKQYQDKLLTYQQYLQSLTSQLSEAEEHERRRLAEGLHDLIGQPLAVIKMKLKAWDQVLYSSDQPNYMNDVLELLEDAIQNTRSLTFDLSPPILYELGLEAGLEFLLEQFEERYGIKYKYEDDGQEKPLEGKVSILLYRCTSELLMNVVKHAEAQSVRLSIARADNNVVITIEDDGIGFTISEKEVGSKRFGLFSIHERLNWINGSFTIQSESGCGTLAVLKAPLKKSENGIRSY